MAAETSNSTANTIKDAQSTSKKRKTDQLAEDDPLEDQLSVETLDPSREDGVQQLAALLSRVLSNK
jgi:hypothetical protein